MMGNIVFEKKRNLPYVNLNADGEFTFEEPADPYPFETNGSGFIFLIYTTCDATPITLP